MLGLFDVLVCVSCGFMVALLVLVIAEVVLATWWRIGVCVCLGMVRYVGWFRLRG